MSDLLEATASMTRSTCRRRPGLVGLLATVLACSAVHGAEAITMRVESAIFVDRGTAPVATSLTLFRDGLAWDFLDGTRAGDGGEIVLHDPARERVVVIDSVRNVKTEIDALRLERLSVSLATWARRSDDRLVRWAGGPDFDEGCREEDRRLELSGPRVRYEVDFTPAPSAEAAEIYRQFADTALLLKALLHPGGVPPFPRLAINKRIATAGAMPESVTLQIDSLGAFIGGRPQLLRSVHKIHPRLLATDIQRIEDAEARVAVAESVDLATYVGPDTAAPTTAEK